MKVFTIKKGVLLTRTLARESVACDAVLGTLLQQCRDLIARAYVVWDGKPKREGMITYLHDDQPTRPAGFNTVLPVLTDDVDYFLVC